MIRKHSGQEDQYYNPWRAKGQNWNANVESWAWHKEHGSGATLLKVEPKVLKLQHNAIVANATLVGET